MLADLQLQNGAVGFPCLPLCILTNLSLWLIIPAGCRGTSGLSVLRSCRSWAPIPAYAMFKTQSSPRLSSRPLQLPAWTFGSQLPLWSNFLPLPGSFLNSQVTNFQPDYNWVNLAQALLRHLHNLSCSAAAVVEQKLSMNCRQNPSIFTKATMQNIKIYCMTLWLLFSLGPYCLLSPHCEKPTAAFCIWLGKNLKLECSDHEFLAK